MSPSGKQARTSTERSRLHRDRIAAGESIVRGPIPKWLSEQLVQSGLYPESDDPEALLNAVVAFIALKTRK